MGSIYFTKVRKLYCLEPSKKTYFSKYDYEYYEKFYGLIKEANDIFEIEDHSLDFAYSLGVLHHIIDFNKAMHSFCIKLKDGAPGIVIFVSTILESRKNIYRLISKLINIIRIIISRMPI